MKHALVVHKSTRTNFADIAFFIVQKEISAEVLKSKIIPVLDKIEKKAKEEKTDYLVGNVSPRVKSRAINNGSPRVQKVTTKLYFDLKIKCHTKMIKHKYPIIKGQGATVKMEKIPNHIIKGQPTCSFLTDKQVHIKRTDNHKIR